MLELVLRGLYPLMLVASLWLLLRGHNAPGGGFAGGLVAVAASAAWAIAFGADAARRRMPAAPERLAMAGVLLSLAAGLPALAVGEPYLTHLWWFVPLGFAELPLSTVIAFDLGVYACVWGAVGGYCLALIGGGREEAG
jgi:multicomponent Na+:H+ antiporter subunit B